MSRRIWLAAIVVLGLPNLVAAAVPPEVPHKRKYTIFSAFDFAAPPGDTFGADIVSDGGPSCQGYTSILDLRQITDPTTTPPADANLLGYLNVLSTSAGIFFAAGHANSDVFTVEAYQDDAAGMAAAAAARQRYIDNRVVYGAEIFISQTNDGWAVVITASWIIRVLNTARGNGIYYKHDIVTQFGCNSLNNALAFLNRGHLSRAFIGQSGLVTYGPDPSYMNQITSAIYNNMSGLRSDAMGAYVNAPLYSTLAPANVPSASAGFLTRLLLDSNIPPNPIFLRLYNAPRIVISDVDQDSDFNGSYDREMYRYNPYPSYPYGSGTMPYPGPTAISGQVSGSSGPLRVNLRFSEPMDVSSFTARLRFSDASTQNISGSWDTIEAASDTWTGTATLPNPMSAGVLRLEVFGRKKMCSPGLDTTVQYLDLDGDGTGVPGTYDTSGEFRVKTTAPGGNITDPLGAAFPGDIIQGDQCVVFHSSDSIVASVYHEGPDGVNSGTVPVAGASDGVAWVEPACQLSSGTHAWVVTDQAGNQGRYEFVAATKSLVLTLTANGPLGWSDSDSVSVSADQVQTTNWGFRAETQTCSGELTEVCKRIRTSLNGATAECNYWENCGFLSKVMSTITFSPPWQSSGYSIVNATTSAAAPPITLKAGPAAGGGASVATSTPLAPGETITGYISVPQVPKSVWRSTFGPEVEVTAPLQNISVSSMAVFDSMAAAAQRNLLRPSSPYGYELSAGGAKGVFGTTITINVVYLDAVASDTATVRLYRWEEVRWSSAGLAAQSVSKSTSGLIAIVARSTSTSLYASFFDGTDSSAPLTSWSLQGSSSGFAGTTFVSTYSYLVVSSTDLAVNGFASGVATTYYRIDGLPGDAYSVYSTSLSFLPGTHWVDSYAEDYAGNVSSVTRATITVTAGSVTKLTNSLQVEGNLLVGFLGSGDKAEVVARAEYDYALMVSSVDRRAMLAVDNANFASIGTAPASGRLTLAGVAGDTALALRSGNSTASVTGAQIAFGYDGTSNMRHALFTQHGSADYNNKLVFKLWTPATGSSSTLGNLPVLSLEGSSKTAAGALVHIMPAGLGENELVVSNGTGLGLGNVLRWERWQPSDAKFKTGIERLGPRDEARAWADLMALKPARYRRKVNGPAAPLERGYILEEVPQSLRAGAGVSVDERLVNVELALKGAIAEMDALEMRLKKLRAGRR